jgi:hypothetical protein
MFAVSGPEARLERLEVRLALVVDRDDLAIQNDRHWHLAQRARDRPEDVGERVAVARDEPDRPLPRRCQHPEAVPLRLKEPVLRCAHPDRTPEQHGRGLARLGVGAALIQAKAGEGTSDCPCKHRDGFDSNMGPDAGERL